MMAGIVLVALGLLGLVAWRWKLSDKAAQRAHEFALHSKRVEWDEAEIASQKMMLKRIDERVRRPELRTR